MALLNRMDWYDIARATNWTGMGPDDARMSVRAMKSGAVDFLTKPLTRSALVRSTEAASQEWDRRHSVSAARRAAVATVALLTSRKRAVLLLAARGLSNKDVARELRISHRTVEIHKSHIASKIGARSVLDLAELVARSGLVP